jgi:hypothetical protein
LKVVIANFEPFKNTKNELIVENPSTGWILHAPPRLEIPCEQQLLIELAINSGDFYVMFQAENHFINKRLQKPRRLNLFEMYTSCQ